MMILFLELIKYIKKGGDGYRLNHRAHRLHRIRAIASFRVIPVWLQKSIKKGGDGYYDNNNSQFLYQTYVDRCRAIQTVQSKKSATYLILSP